MPAVLLVANQTLAGGEVPDYVRSRMDDDAVAFTLLVPATPRADVEKSTQLLGNVEFTVASAPGEPRETESADYEHARARLEYGLSTPHQVERRFHVPVTVITTGQTPAVSKGTHG